MTMKLLLTELKKIMMFIRNKLLILNKNADTIGDEIEIDSNEINYFLYKYYY